MFRFLVVFLKRLILGVIVLVGVSAYLLYNYCQTPLTLDPKGMLYHLKSGSSLSAMAYDLQRQGVLKYPKVFILISRATGLAQRVQAGEYLLVNPLNPLELLARLDRGEVQQYQVTLIEGWRMLDVLKSLKQHPKLSHVVRIEDQEWFKAIKKDNDYVSYEGLFYPDTYQFVAGISDSDLLKIAYRRMQAVLAEEWLHRADNLPYKNAYDALIMASLIEKETGLASERPEIAGVFVRRLQKNMRLQTDPAVIYGLGEQFDGNLKLKHLADRSNPYNSYRHKGLPPSPIALAGRAAIHAALHPGAGDSLYFVAKGDGSHHFSATLAEHERAVRQYQIEKRRSNYQSAPASL